MRTLLEKLNYRAVSLMKTDAKVLNKIWASQIQQHIKRIIHHDLVGFTLGFKDVLTHANQSMCYITLIEWKKIIIWSSQYTQEKAFDKIKNQCMIKTLNNFGKEGTYLNITKVIYDKPVNITCNRESFSFKIRKKTRLPLSPGFPSGARDKGPACPCRRHKRPGLGRHPGGGHGYPLQYSCLENPRDRGACWATVHMVAKTQTQVKQLCTHTPLLPLLVNLELKVLVRAIRVKKRNWRHQNWNARSKTVYLQIM